MTIEQRFRLLRTGLACLVIAIPLAVAGHAGLVRMHDTANADDIGISGTPVPFVGDTAPNPGAADPAATATDVPNTPTTASSPSVGATMAPAPEPPPPDVANAAPQTIDPMLVQRFKGTLVLDEIAEKPPADGSALVTVTGRLLDPEGKPYEKDLNVALTTTAGTFIGADTQPEDGGFHVLAKNGSFTAVLRAPVRSGTALIEAQVGSVHAKTSVTFGTSLRSTIAAGSIDIHLGANNANYYGPFENFLSDDDRSTYDTRAFVTGAVGTTQVTAAVDNRNPINGDCSGLTPIYGSTHDLSACRPKYPIYGDSSTITHLANSSDNVYARLEHDRSYVEWGDYQTNEFTANGQTYAATTRTLHGAKSAIQIGKLGFTGIFGLNVQAFQRDAIAPDGTSGSYYLSRRLIVPGSQNVSLELEPIDRPGTVVSVTPMNNGVDYDLDPVTGALVFRQPVAKVQLDPTTGAVLVQHIVATYQYDAGSSSNAIGGRLQYGLGGAKVNPSAIGVSVFDENMGARKFLLESADVAVAQAGHDFHGEVARSRSLDEFGTTQTGGAYRVDEKFTTGGLRLGGFVQHADSGFLNDAAAASFVAGQTRFGALFDAKVGARTTLSLHADREIDSGTAPTVITDPASYLNPGTAPVLGQSIDSRLSTFGADVAQKIGKGMASLGIANNSFTNYLGHASDTSNTQGTLRLSMPFAQRFTAFGLATETLGGQATALYPSREGIGVGYKIADGVSIGLTEEALHGGAVNGDRHFTSLGVEVDRHLDDNTQTTAKYSLIDGLGGISAQEEIGLNHKIPLAKHLRGDVGFEYTNGALGTPNAAGQPYAQPFAVGNDTASLLLTGGTSYHAGLELVGVEKLKAGARYEHSDSLYGVNDVLRLNVAGSLTDAAKVLASFDRRAAANQQLGSQPIATDGNIGFAFRDPRSDAHNYLVSFEFRNNPGLIPTQLLTTGQQVQQNTLVSQGSIITQDATLALDGIESLTSRLELYGKLATRKQQTQFAPGQYSSATLQFDQFRLKYLLGRRFDVAGELRNIIYDTGGYHETGFVGEFGYLVTSELRLATGYSGGKIDQYVFDNGRSKRGMFVDLTLRVKQLWKPSGATTGTDH